MNKKLLIAVTIIGLLLAGSLCAGASSYYVGSRYSDVYHYTGCYYVDNIKYDNLIYFSTPNQAINAGYRACKVCSPPTWSDPPLPITGYISISSNPSGASIYLDYSYKGTTPITLEDVTTGSHNVKLKKSGYSDIYKTVTVYEDTTTSISETLVMETGAISISSNPSGVKVYLDNLFKGSTPITLKDVTTGTHTIKLVKSGYDDFSDSVTVISGRTEYVSETLVMKTGAISISSNPDGADVYLDNLFKGSTPITLKDVTTGTHTVKLIKSGYNDFSDSVTVISGRTEYISETLVMKTGAINIYSNPSGAEIYVNGDYVGTTPNTIHNLTQSSYKIKLTKSGFNDISKTITVNPDQTTYVSESLSIQTGDISISSNPSGADVYLDDTYTGITPLKIETSVGRHQITFSKPNYYDITEVVYVIENETIEISPYLTTFETPTEEAVTEMEQKHDRYQTLLNKPSIFFSKLFQFLSGKTYNSV